MVNVVDVSSDCFFEVVIVGGGTCGLAVALRLCENAPGLIYTEEEHQRFHWLKKRGHKVSTIHKGMTKTLKYVSPATLGPENILVLDAIGDKFMTGWDNQFRSCQIPHLRLPMFFHPDPVNIDGMITYAHTHKREKDLMEIQNVVGKEYSKHQLKRTMKKAKKSMKGKVPAVIGDQAGGKNHDRSGIVDINMRDWRDYYRTLTPFFRDFCNDLIERYNIGDCVKKDEVVSLKYVDLNVYDKNFVERGFFVETASGKCYGCKTCVVASGHRGKINYPIKGLGEKPPLEAACHTTDIFYEKVPFPHPRLCEKLETAQKKCMGEKMMEQESMTTKKNLNMEENEEGEKTMREKLDETGNLLEERVENAMKDENSLVKGEAITDKHDMRGTITSVMLNEPIDPLEKAMSTDKEAIINATSIESKQAGFTGTTPNERNSSVSSSLSDSDANSNFSFELSRNSSTEDLNCDCHLDSVKREGNPKEETDVRDLAMEEKKSKQDPKMQEEGEPEKDKRRVKPGPNFVSESEYESAESIACKMEMEFQKPKDKNFSGCSISKEEAMKNCAQEHFGQMKEKGMETSPSRKSSGRRRKKSQFSNLPHIVIVGGGLTLAQLAHVACTQGFRVTLVLRGPLKIKHFDFHLDWVTKYKNVKKLAFYILDTDEERAQLIQDARGGGLINPEYHFRLQKHQALGRLELLKYTTVENGKWDDKMKMWNIDLVTKDEDDMQTQNVNVDYVVCATGIAPDLKSLGFMNSIMEEYPIDIVGGFPCLTDNLQWTDDLPLYMVGKNASLRIGPTSANLDGARTGAERVGWKIQEDLAKERRSPNDTRLQLAGGNLNWYTLLLEA